MVPNLAKEMSRIFHFSYTQTDHASEWSIFLQIFVGTRHFKGTVSQDFPPPIFPNNLHSADFQQTKILTNIYLDMFACPFI